MKTATVEADLRQGGIGIMAVGFPGAGSTAVFEETDQSLWVEFSRAGLLRLRRRSNGTVANIASVDLAGIGYAAGNTVTVRLVYSTSPSARADVYINGIRRITNAGVGFSPSIRYAGFQARTASSSSPYFEADGDVDNFVVTLSPQ